MELTVPFLMLPSRIVGLLVSSASYCWRECLELSMSSPQTPADTSAYADHAEATIHLATTTIRALIILRGATIRSWRARPLDPARAHSTRECAEARWVQQAFHSSVRCLYTTNDHIRRSSLSLRSGALSTLLVAPSFSGSHCTSQ